MSAVENNAVFAGATARRAGIPTALTLALVIAGLYLACDVFIPLTLAVLLAFLQAPLVAWLQKYKLPKIAAVGSVVGLTLVAIAGMDLLVVRQISDLADELPRYQSNVQAKTRAIANGDAGSSVLARISQALHQLDDELARGVSPMSPPTVSPPSATLSAERSPIPVTIVGIRSSPVEALRSVVGPLLPLLGLLSVLLVVAPILLLQGDELRERVLRVAGVGDHDGATGALTDAGSRISRYLLARLLVNLGYGAVVCGGLFLIGIPSPLLWGGLAVLLRFVPYLGPVLIAIPPVLLSVAVDTGWTMLPWTIALFVVLEGITGNVIEPWLYSEETGLSPFAIVLAAIFWTWLWGPIGLILSVPLTVCVVALSRHLPRLEFLAVLLGTDPIPAAPDHQG